MNTTAQYIKDQEIPEWHKEILDESLKEFEETGEAEDWEVLKLKFKQKYGF